VPIADFRYRTALWICIFNDLNSVFQVREYEYALFHATTYLGTQCTLAACMWSMNRFQRPAWTTSILILLAFSCGITSGVLIWRGGKKTKRTERVEERLRRVLEMDELGHALAPESVLSKLQDAIARRTTGNKPDTDKNGVGSSEKVSESKPVPNGTNRPDYEGTITSSVGVPAIRIEEEMVVPPSK
jgi:hypothetical protein